MRKVLIGFALFVTACSQGVAAPDIAGTETVCSDVFCIDVPGGWVAEVGDTYVAFNHEADPDNTFLTAGILDEEAIVTGAGGTWPVPTEDVVVAFWSLLESSGVGSFERSQRMVGGAVRSWGDHETGRMWHVVYPTGGSTAIGVELRAPNDSWESHADVVFASITPIEQ
ncbi:MAG: hypothetical protein ABFR53_07455 [Actinomycetota bacterium]